MLPDPSADRAILQALAEYARELEEQLFGSDAGEGEALIATNSRLVDDRPIVFDESEEWGQCADNTETPGGPHMASPSLCVFCLEYDPE